MIEDLSILELSDDLGILIKSIEGCGSQTGKNLEDLWLNYSNIRTTRYELCKQNCLIMYYNFIERYIKYQGHRDNSIEIKLIFSSIYFQSLVAKNIWGGMSDRLIQQSSHYHIFLPYIYFSTFNCPFFIWF